MTLYNIQDDVRTLKIYWHTDVKIGQLIRSKTCHGRAGQNKYTIIL